MKKILIISIITLALVVIGCSLDEETPTSPEPGPQPLNKLCINEFMSHNNNVDIPEAPGDFPDWIELYNGTDTAIDIGGMYITDDLSELDQSMIGDDDPALTTIQPGGYLVLVADGEPQLGTLHLDCKLSDDEDFALVDKDGSTIIDQHNTTVIPDDQSEGRVPDGHDEWQILNPSTPGGPNH
ncbi:MAG TPA: hypothetical protein DHM37_02990 [Candidatus Cloacimonas sp.]|jgi:hypothetical protein|nr:hypothetical protein [Candidatus Cloacimonadota bacterium]HCX72659.1 hypothetical protein [Candidatus Cloacimonas sp.]